MALTRLQNPTISRLFHNRNFCIYFAGRTVSVVGDSFYSVVLILAVLQSTHSVTSGAMVLLAGTIPIVILTLVGGTVSDRLPRNRVMVSSDLVRSATQFAMAALLLRSSPPLWALMITQFCYGLGDAFFDPASTGLLPQIVASEDLPAANSMLQLSSNSAVVVAPALAGIIIALAGAPLAVALDAVSFLVSAISLYFLTVPRGALALASDSMLDQLRAGFVELRRRKWALVTACYLAFLAFAFNGTIFVLGPAVALSRLGGPSAWSLMLSAFGVGLISGSLVALKLLRTRRALGWAYLGNFGVVPLLALLGTSDSKWFVVGSSALAGLSISVFGVTYPTLLQQTVPKEILSRVGSYFWLARVAPMPLAFAIVGPLSARFGISAVFNVAALSLGVATLVGAGFPEIWAIAGPPREIDDNG
jgi:MFS family permease